MNSPKAKWTNFSFTVSRNQKPWIHPWAQPPSEKVTDTHTETDGQIHDGGMYCVSIASRGKNRPYCTRPTKYNYYAGNERWLIEKCTVIITYLNDNAQTPLNRLAVYMLYSQLCNTYGDKSNRWSIGLI